MDGLKILVVDNGDKDSSCLVEDILSNLKERPQIINHDNIANALPVVTDVKPDFVLLSEKIAQKNIFPFTVNCENEFPRIPIILIVDNKNLETGKTGAWITLERTRMNMLPAILENAFLLRKEKTKALHAERELQIMQERIGMQSKLLYQTLDKAPGSFIVTDKQGDIQYVNAKFEEITGYRDYEVLGNNTSMLKSGLNDEKIYLNLWDTITSNKEWHGELINRRKNGENYWASLYISSITDESGEIINFLAVQNDITEQKNYEQNLIKAKEKAEESDRLKSSFLATLSHELRTPLNAVINFSEIIDHWMNAGDQINQERVIKMVKMINSNGNDLLNIVNSVMSMSLLQAGLSKVKKEEIDLNSFLDELAHFLNSKMLDKQKEGVQILQSKSAAIQAIKVKSDKAKLLQVMKIYLDNALKFTTQGSIDYGFKTDGISLTFFVADTGIGISKEKQSLIFEQFQQAEDTLTRKYGGMGLGLAICKEISLLMNAPIGVESEPGKGSTFFITLEKALLAD